ncbi:MAG TPA: FAD-dependent oxidoreductase [Candidatus Limnocylindrales bacterium]|nr:FAD-dependent oxidoreductase [Candidatus Limnocylindrales bacterium]
MEAAAATIVAPPAQGAVADPSPTPASWPTFESRLVARELVADRTMAFTFEKPAGWDYRAGQFIDITLLDPPETDAEGNTRGVSISSAPSEGVITITTRLRDTAFKRVLQGMPLGTTVKIEGPFGDLRLHHADRPAVVLTGGIGITPFRSILVHATRTGGLPYRVFVFYGNRRPEDAAYLEELGELAKREPNLVFVPTMSDLSLSERPWDGERGRIDAAMVRRHLEAEAAAIYYLTGPPAMVAGLRSMLLTAGVDEDDIRTEEFTGY